MSKKRWFRFYVDRWFTGTFGLSANEIAAYITIVCELYDHDGIVELDIEVMSRRCGMRPTSFRNALDGLVKRGKVSLEAGYLTQDAVSEEISSREKLGEKSTKSRANRREKHNVFNGNVAKVPSYTDNQSISIYSTIKGSREPTPAMLEAAAKSPAVAGLLKRRYRNGRAKETKQ